MDDYGCWEAGATGALTASREALSTKGKSRANLVCRLVPLAVALLLVAILAVGVVLPLADMWRSGPNAVLVEP